MAIKYSWLRAENKRPTGCGRSRHAADAPMLPAVAAASVLPALPVLPVLPALPTGEAAVHFATQCQLAWENGVPEQVLACILVSNAVVPDVCARVRLHVDTALRQACAALAAVRRK